MRPPFQERPARLFRRLQLAALLLAIAACGSPTESGPVQRWSLAGATATAPISVFVSDGVGTDSTGAAFTILAFPSHQVDDITLRLFDFCDACAAADQQRIPKPAFTAGLGVRQWLPVGLRSAVITGGRGTVGITNYLGFDPLRPAPGTVGAVTAVYFDPVGGDTLGSRTVSGDTHSLPPGSGLSFWVPIHAGVVRELRASVTLTSPTGDSVTMDPGQSLEVLASVWDLRAAMIDVEVPIRLVTATGAMDLTDAVQELGAKQIDSAHVRVRIASPFTMTAAATLTFRAGTTTFTRAGGLAAPGAEEKLVRLSGSEARSLLGKVTTFSVTGYVTAPSLILTPGEPVPVASAVMDVFGRS